MSQLKDRIEKLRKQRAQSARPLPAELVVLVEEAGQVMVRRNELVHSLWSNPTLAEAKGWRPARKKDRVIEANPVAWVFADEPGLQSLVADLVRVAIGLRDVVSNTSAAT